MALKTTVDEMKKLIQGMLKDLEKSVKGNRAASQRARTHSIKFSKVAKIFRKESILEGKKAGKKGSVKKAAAPKKAAKKAAPRKKAAAKKKR